MTQKILSWYSQHKRDLPWRNTLNPYKIWVSEIILQQTQIKTGAKYYHLFIEKFPNVESLSNASDIDILNIWQGLGYYNRALNMLVSAKIVMTHYKGVFPSKYNDLLQLKGVGAYTAAAISSICTDEKKAVVDGNVYRFLSRFYNIDTPINTSSGKKEFQNIADQLIPNKKSGTYNQAIMDFGSLQCKKNNPKCNICPFKSKCKAFVLGTVHLRPVKNKHMISKIRYFNYLLIKNNNHFIVQQRGINDIWKKLYEMPLIESNTGLTKSKITKHKYVQSFNIKDIKLRCSMTHKLSHQKLKILFWDLNTEKLNCYKKFQQISMDEISQYPFPSPLKKYFDKEHLSI